MHFFGGGVVWCGGNGLFKHSTIKEYLSVSGGEKKDEGLNKWNLNIYIYIYILKKKKKKKRDKGNKFEKPVAFTLCIESNWV